MSQTLNCIADLSTAHRTTRAAGMSPLSKRALAIHCVPMLAHASEVLFFDDDVVVSPRMADIFEAVEPALIGAVFERHKPQGWHSMHWRTACAIYNVSSCKPKSSLLFNSGVMLLSRQHLPLLARWQERQLECRVLCDQLFFNAVAAQRGIAVSDLGASFNFVGSEVRRAVVTSSEGRCTRKSALVTKGSLPATARSPTNMARRVLCDESTLEALLRPPFCNQIMRTHLQSTSITCASVERSKKMQALFCISRLFAKSCLRVE